MYVYMTRNCIAKMRAIACLFKILSSISHAHIIIFTTMPHTVQVYFKTKRATCIVSYTESGRTVVVHSNIRFHLLPRNAIFETMNL